MYLSKNIRYLRKKMGLSQVALSDLIGAKRNTISDYERGRSNPSIELIQKMATLFRVSIGAFIEKDMSRLSTIKPINYSSDYPNQLEESAAPYEIQKNTPQDTARKKQQLEIDNSSNNTLIEKLRLNIQQLKQQNEAKDKEIFYLQNLLEAKNQSILNLKKLIEYLESAKKQG